MVCEEFQPGFRDGVPIAVIPDAARVALVREQMDRREEAGGDRVTRRAVSRALAVQPFQGGPLLVGREVCQVRGFRLGGGTHTLC